MLEDPIDAVIGEEHLLMVTSALPSRSDFHVATHFAVDLGFFPLIEGQHKKILVFVEKCHVFDLFNCTPMINMFSICFESFFMFFLWAFNFSCRPEPISFRKNLFSFTLRFPRDKGVLFLFFHVSQL
jgi:hypothetical protein